MKKIIGIDPGKKTGIAIFIDGKLNKLLTTTPFELMVSFLPEEKPGLVVFEDSRLISYMYNVYNSKSSQNMASSMKMARNVGTIDAWCSLIDDFCNKNDIECFGVSAKKKGSKIDSKAFFNITGYDLRSNEHERDAAMVVISSKTHLIR